MDRATVSVIIVNWNHGRFLASCLDALQTLAYAPLEIVVVDNGSTDGSPEWLTRRYPGVRMLRSAENRGFSWALNEGIRHTNSAFVLSLNPDVTVCPGFVSEMVHAIDKDDRYGMAAPKLLRADATTILDSTGLFVDRRRRTYDRGQGQLDEGQYDGQRCVFGACGAAGLYRRTMLEDVALGGEVLDEDMFAYCEDADLAWRAQLRGWHCVYAPQAVAMHVRGWGDTLRKRGHAQKTGRGPRLALRNRYLMTVKNDAWPYLLGDVPRILAAELPRLAFAALTAPEVLLGLVDLVRALPAALRKRKQIRSRRTVDEAQIRRWFVAPTKASVPS